MAYRSPRQPNAGGLCECHSPRIQSQRAINVPHSRPPGAYPQAGDAAANVAQAISRCWACKSKSAEASCIPRNSGPIIWEALRHLWCDNGGKPIDKRRAQFHCAYDRLLGPATFDAKDWWLGRSDGPRGPCEEDAVGQEGQPVPETVLGLKRGQCDSLWQKPAGRQSSTIGGSWALWARPDRRHHGSWSSIVITIHLPPTYWSQLTVDLL